jgi:quercetin dioxygenase-like cupin family protein
LRYAKKAYSLGEMSNPTIVPSIEEALPGPFGLTIRVRSEQTNGVISVIEETLVPKAFIPPHSHRNDVWVYVLSGEIGVLVGGEIAEVRSGDWALKPRDVQHAMWNAAADSARIIEVLTPGGSERWFEEMATALIEDQAGFDRLSERYGIEFFRDSPWIDELCRRYGVGLDREG